MMLVVSIVPLLVVGGLVYNGMNSSQESAGRSVDDSKTALEIDVVQRNLSEEAHRLAMELEKDMADRVVLGLFCANGVAATGAVTSQLPQDINKADFLLMEQLKDTQYLSMFQYFGPEIPDPVHPGETIIPLLGGAYSWLGSAVPGAFPFFLVPAQASGWMGIWLAEIVVPIMNPAGVQQGTLVCTTGFFPILMSPEYAKTYPNMRVMIFSRANEIMVDTGDWELSDQDIDGNGLLDDVVPVATDAAGNPVQRWYDFQADDKVAQASIDFTLAEQQVRNAIASAQGNIIPPTAFTTEDSEFVVGYARSSITELHGNYQWAGYNGIGFTVMVEQSEDIAFAPLASVNELEDDLSRNTSTVMITLATVLALAIIAALVMAFTFSRSVTKPISELRDVADKISKGEMDVKIDIKSKDEIGDLAESFGRMVAAVRFLSQDQEKGDK
jgi:HAMP domain-containing protein